MMIIIKYPLVKEVVTNVVIKSLNLKKAILDLFSIKRRNLEDILNLKQNICRI